jgi:hypothetical protein
LLLFSSLFFFLLLFSSLSLSYLSSFFLSPSIKVSGEETWRRKKKKTTQNLRCGGL